MEIKFEKYIANTLEIKELGNAYKFIFDIMENEGKALINNQFIRTADLITIREWEKFLGIVEDNDLTLDDRRMQILMKLTLKPPYSLNNVMKQIYAITGIENKIIEDRENLSLDIDLTSVTKGAIKLVHQYMKRVKPTNVVYQISTRLDELDDTNPYFIGCSIMQYINVD